MKRILLTAVFAIATIVLGHVASAQYIPTPPDPAGIKSMIVNGGEFAGVYDGVPIEVDNGYAFFITRPGTPITLEQARTAFSPEDYETYRSGRSCVYAARDLERIGLVCLLVSGTGTLAYMFAGYGGMVDVNTKVLWGFAAGAGVGIGCIVAAVPIRAIGKGKVDAFAKRYNASIRHADVAFGGTTNGVGFVMNF